MARSEKKKEWPKNWPEYWPSQPNIPSPLYFPGRRRSTGKLLLSPILFASTSLCLSLPRILAQSQSKSQYDHEGGQERKMECEDQPRPARGGPPFSLPFRNSQSKACCWFLSFFLFGIPDHLLHTRTRVRFYHRQPGRSLLFFPPNNVRGRHHGIVHAGKQGSILLLYWDDC